MDIAMNSKALEAALPKLGDLGHQGAANMFAAFDGIALLVSDARGEGRAWLLCGYCLGGVGEWAELIGRKHERRANRDRDRRTLAQSTKDRPSEKLCLKFLKRLPDAYLLV